MGRNSGSKGCYGVNFDAKFMQSFGQLQGALRELRTLVVDAAGGERVRYKQDGTPQTNIDIEVENRLFKKLEICFPGIKSYGEESGYSDILPDVCWLVDGVDGTKSFIKNIPAYTGMLVLIEHGEPVASIIYDYANDDMYTAIKGQGAYKNDEILDLRKMPLPSKAFCRERMVEAVNSVLIEAGLDVQCTAGPSGAGNGFIKVAAGSLAARFNFPHRPGGGYMHDYAPGALLILEAHGDIIAVDAAEYTLTCKSFIACHPQLTSSLRGHVSRLRSIELNSA